MGGWAGQVQAGGGGFRIENAEGLRWLWVAASVPPTKPRSGLKAPCHCGPAWFFPRPSSIFTELQGGQNSKTLMG